MNMKLGWLIVALVTLAVVAAAPADARHRQKAKLHCIDKPAEFSWSGIWFNPKPRPNGCAPAVYQFGEYVGQDPDPNIRFQLLRDPRTGYMNSTTH
jgi:hypothetical protein